MLLQLELRRAVWHICNAAAVLSAHAGVLRWQIIVWRVCFDPVRAVRAVCAGIPVFVLKGYYQVRVAVGVFVLGLGVCSALASLYWSQPWPVVRLVCFFCAACLAHAVTGCAAEGDWWCWAGWGWACTQMTACMQDQCCCSASQHQAARACIRPLHVTQH